MIPHRWSVRQLDARDLPVALSLCQEEGWDVTIDDLADFIACRGHALAAGSENGLLGIVMAMVYPPLAWIGNLVVVRSCRGRGIGSTLLSSLLRQLKASGVVHTAVLEARPGTSGFYTRFGFEPFATTVRYRMKLALRPERAFPATDGPAHPFAEECTLLAESVVDHMFRLDRKAFGADRRDLLTKIHARAAFTLGAWRHGNLLAYLMVRPSANGYRIGPWVSSTSDTQLLDRALNLLPSLADPARIWVVAAVPEQAIAARAALVRAGFLQVAEGMRMVLRLSPPAPSADIPLPHTDPPPSLRPQVWALAGLDRG